MKKVRLKVITVPASDPDTFEAHTAYAVLHYDKAGRSDIRYACGWTLRDAISRFCEHCLVDRASIELLRPFRPQQGLEDYGEQW